METQKTEPARTFAQALLLILVRFAAKRLFKFFLRAHALFHPEIIIAIVDRAKD